MRRPDRAELAADKTFSPRDHAILESAYQKNSKPDKEERLNLVKQVELGEKEVQVRLRHAAHLGSTPLANTPSRSGFRTADRTTAASQNHSSRMS